jgi:hypothetical protein
VRSLEWRGRRCYAPVVIDSGSAGAPRTRGDVDKDPQESGNTKASPGGLGAVLVDWEVSTEEFLATVIFGDDATLDLLHVLDKRMASVDASDQGKEVRLKERARAYLGASESSSHRGSTADLRRGISAAWRRF